MLSQSTTGTHEHQFEARQLDVLKACGISVEAMQDDAFLGRCAVLLAQRGYTQQVHSCLNGLASCVFYGILVQALDLAQRLDGQQSGLSKVVYSSILKTLIDMKNWSEAYDIFKRLRDAHVRLDATLLQQVTQVLAENKRWHLLGEVTKHQRASPEHESRQTLA